MHQRYSIQWAGHCMHENGDVKSDKVWGWFYYKDLTMLDTNDPLVRRLTAYAFWGASGKSLSFKSHGRIPAWKMSNLVVKKNNRGYKEITISQLESMWESLYSTMDVKFVQYILAAD